MKKTRIKQGGNEGNVNEWGSKETGDRNKAENKEGDDNKNWKLRMHENEKGNENKQEGRLE